MSGGVDLDLHVAVFQLHQAPPDLHLLAEGIQQLLPQLIHLQATLLAGVRLDLGWNTKRLLFRSEGRLHALEESGPAFTLDVADVSPV